MSPYNCGRRAWGAAEGPPPMLLPLLMGQIAELVLAVCLSLRGGAAPPPPGA